MFQLDFQYSFINKAWKTCQKTFQRLLLDPLPSFRVCDIDVDIRPPPKLSRTLALCDTKKSPFSMKVCEPKWGQKGDDHENDTHVTNGFVEDPDFLPMVFLCFLNGP